MLFKKYVLLEVSYFARNIYEMDAVTSGLCHIKDLIFLENNLYDFEINWMSSQLIVQWNYIIHFHFRGSFLTGFCASFWKRVHIQKKL